MKHKKPLSAQALAGSAFDDAMHRLGSVPKNEVDAEERKYKTMRKRLEG
jgi:hypothetical protein